MSFSPSKSLATLRPDLGAAFEELTLEADRLGFIGLRVMPAIDVAEAGGTFPRIKLASLLRNAETKRNPGAGYQRGTFEFEDQAYSTQEHGFEWPVDDNLARKYRNYFSAEMQAARMCRDVVLRNQEKRIATLAQDTGTLTNAAAAVAWGTAATAVPVTDVETRAQAIAAATGLWPNAVIMSRKAYRNCRATNQVRDRIASTGAGYPTRARDVTLQQLAEVFDVDYVLVAGSYKNNAAEGAAVSLASIWDDAKVTVARIAVEPQNIQEACFGRTFHWGEDGSQIGTTYETYRDEKLRGDVVRHRHQVQELVYYAAAAQVITGV